MSIWFEVVTKWNNAFDGEDDSTLMRDILSGLDPSERDLAIREDMFTDTLRAEHGLKPDFDQICERSIMERFAAEEAARVARSA